MLAALQCPISPSFLFLFAPRHAYSSVAITMHSYFSRFTPAIPLESSCKAEPHNGVAYFSVGTLNTTNDHGHLYSEAASKDGEQWLCSDTSPAESDRQLHGWYVRVAGPSPASTSSPSFPTIQNLSIKGLLTAYSTSPADICLLLSPPSNCDPGTCPCVLGSDSLLLFPWGNQCTEERGGIVTTSSDGEPGFFTIRGAGTLGMKDICVGHILDGDIASWVLTYRDYSIPGNMSMLSVWYYFLTSYKR
jgi:hypothetical protein